MPEGLGSPHPAAGRAQDRALAAFLSAAARLPDRSDPAARARLAAAPAGAPAALGRSPAEAAEGTGARVLVETSKSPERTLAFDRLPAAQVRVLNLVRDPRAVAVGWWRKAPGPLRPWRNLRLWRARPARLSAWAPALGPRFRRLYPGPARAVAHPADEG